MVSIYNKPSYNIAVVGATGNVGRNILQILHDSSFPIGNIVALASTANQDGNQRYVHFSDKTIEVQALNEFDFTGTDLVFSSIRADITREYAPKAIKSGAIIIDNSSAYRMDSKIPLIVPEVNISSMYDLPNQIIASPNCVAIPLSVVLGPLHVSGYPIKRICVSTYQSVSGAGYKNMENLLTETQDVIDNQPISPQFAFNVIPQIDTFNDDGTTGEEQKVINEFGKIVDDKIQIAITCVRVPVFIGHTMAVNVEFRDDIELESLIQKLESGKGISVLRNVNQYVTPIDCAHKDEVFVSRIRRDASLGQRGINMWIACDNVRKGAALNVVQIAKEYISNQMQKAV